MREGGEFEIRVIPPKEEDDEEVRPGFGTMRDMKRRGRAMAEQEHDRIPGEEVLRLVPARYEDEEEEPEAEDEGTDEADEEVKDQEGGEADNNPARNE